MYDLPRRPALKLFPFEAKFQWPEAWAWPGPTYFALYEIGAICQKTSDVFVCVSVRKMAYITYTNTRCVGQNRKPYVKGPFCTWWWESSFAVEAREKAATAHRAALV